MTPVTAIVVAFDSAHALPECLGALSAAGVPVIVVDNASTDESIAIAEGQGARVIRNHRPDRMVKAFEIAGYGEQEVMERFGGMYRAFQYGAPPHGGMAAGVDRIVMLLCGAQNLREITLFPMNQKAEDLLLGAPSDVTPKQLRELHIRLNLPEK